MKSTTMTPNDHLAIAARILLPDPRLRADDQPVVTAGRAATAQAHVALATAMRASSGSWQRGLGETNVQPG